MNEPAAATPFRRRLRSAPCALALALSFAAAASAQAATARAPSAHAALAASDAPACALAAAPPAEFAMRIPFETIDGRIYVQAKVNGRGPFRFAVDTGASGMARADSSLVAALGLRTGTPTTNSDGVNTSEIATTTFDSLDVGGLVRRDMEVPTRDYASRAKPGAAFSGIVAREFFADGLLVIDYPRRTLSFSRKLALSPAAPGSLAYERAFRVPIAIGELQVEGNLDTGANVAFVLPQALFDRVGGTAPRDAGGGQLANTRIDTQSSIVAGPFRIGDATLRDVEVRISDRYPELLVGAGALQDSVVLIDQRSQAVAVCPE